MESNNAGEGIGRNCRESVERATLARNIPQMGHSSQSAYSQNSLQHSLPFHFLKEIEISDMAIWHGTMQERDGME